jgi:hypothetical protein
MSLFRWQVPARRASLLVATAIALMAPAAGAYAAPLPPDVIYSSANDGTAFATIDPTTGVGTVLGSSGFGGGWAAALDTDGTLWTIVNGFGTAQIATVSKTTGQATPVGSPIGTQMIALEIAPDGTMYGIGYGDGLLYRISKTTGVGTAIGLGTGINGTMDVAFDCAGQLWATTNGDLWTVDTVTGTSVAQPAITGVGGGGAMVMGLMFDRACRLFGTTYETPGNLYSIDPGTGAAALIGSTGLNAPHGGSSGVFGDATAPTTTDDVPAAFQSTPVAVTLAASDADGSGVDDTYYEIGETPAEPTTASALYDAADKPTLDDGQRIRYFSVDVAGNAETPHSSAVARVDTQSPTTTDDVPAAAQSSAFRVSLSASDSGGSGLGRTYYTVGANPAVPTTSSAVYDAANKPSLSDGERISYFSTDRVGNTEAARTSLAAAVSSPPPDPGPAAPAPEAAAVLCGKPIVLTDVTLRGGRVRLGGVTRAEYAGQPVIISGGGGIVARTVAAADGTFRTTAERSARSERLRYRARVQGERSAALKATRLLVIDRQVSTAGGQRIRGHLVGRRRAGRAIGVDRLLGCSSASTRRSMLVRTGARGRFTVVLPNPSATAKIAVYRLRTLTGATTYTLPVVVRTP